MLFVDLNKMKIIKEFQYDTCEREISFDLNKPVLAQAEALRPLFTEIIKPNPIAICYNLIIPGDGETTIDEIDDLLSAVNAIIGVFFSCMTTTGGRKREHRFDVPQRMMSIKVNRSTLKKAINYATINDIFNLTIRYKDITYILCDEKEDKDLCSEN